MESKDDNLSLEAIYFVTTCVFCRVLHARKERNTQKRGKICRVLLARKRGTF